MVGRFTQILLFIFSAFLMQAQNETGILSGKVSYVTSNNIYVRFDDTNQIEIGDTLLMSEGNFLKPCLIVSQKSSTSCVGKRITESQLAVGDLMIFKVKIVKPVEAVEEIIEEKEDLPLDTIIKHEDPVIVDKRFKENIRARLSASSYSSFPADREARHRLMYRFSLRANNIKDSKFSLESYLNYRQNIEKRNDTIDRQNNFFRVYNLALNYDVDSTMRITIGRKINYKASSLGAIDGLQVEKSFGRTYVGVITGFRPDIFEYSFNADLLEYGSYMGYQVSNRAITFQSTLGFLEQKNGGNVDRRYVYFQHSSTINRKLNLFTSFEGDLYNKVNGISTSSFRLTNLYVSARYRFNRQINLTVSYDSRKRIIYYETLRTEVEKLLADDESRQGARIRLNIRPFKYISTGISYGRRFQSSQQNKSENINAYINLSRVPTIGGSLSMSFNMNTTLYLESKIYAVRHSRSIVQGKLNADFYFRNVNYDYLGSETQFVQNYIGMNMMFRMTRKLSLSLLSEVAIKDSEKNYRINTKLIKRFGK